jgi:3-hydroxyisobutyrate dehydrogenase
MIEKVGFVGLGAMGKPMSRRIKQTGFALGVYDNDAGRLEQIAAELSVRPASSLSALARECDAIVTMLPNSTIVEKVLCGEGGVLEGLAPGSLVLEMSSGDPNSTQMLAERVQVAGSQLVDAPVSGGVPRAETGELAIMVGGADADVARARPLLEAMGRSIVHTGKVGTAHAMKSLNNLVSAGGFLIGIEALLIGARFGLDPALMVDVLNASTGMNNSTQKKFKQYVLSRSFDAGFGLDLMVKDLSIALDVARSTGTTAPFSTLCKDMWAGSKSYLGSGRDHTAVALFSEMLAGSRLEAGDGENETR